MTAPTHPPLDALFGALADPTRRDLLRVVIARGPLNVGELAAGRDITRQAVAKHLAVLVEAGLLTASRVGRETRYEGARAGLAPAGRWLRETETAWDRRLDRLRRQVAARRATSPS